MKLPYSNDESKFDILSSLVRKTDDNSAGSDENLEDSCVRARIVSRTRWITLGVLAVYSVFAAFSFSVSTIGFQFTSRQIFFLLLTLLAVVIYNYPLGTSCALLSRLPYLIHLQIGLDLFFVTVLIHFTGGVFSWFWPVYLLVTLEAAFLFDDRRDVWLIGSLGAAFYGALLAAESVHLFLPVNMPFVDSSQHDVLLFQILMWLWVAGMNATVAFIAAFLMTTIRKDNLRVRQSEEALLGFISTANDLIFCTDNKGKILYSNQAFSNVITQNRDTDSGECGLFDLVVSKDRERLVELVNNVMSSNQPAHIDVSFTTIESLTVDVEMSISAGEHGNSVWVVARDITERNRAQSALYSLAHHDILTGLPNRVLLEDRLTQAKAIAHRQHSGFALLFIDLDRFKIINDTLGHAIGDELLRMVATRLQRTLRETDTVARIGGDEFIVVLVNTGDRNDVTALIEKLMKALALPFYLRAHELFVTASLGCCMYPSDDIDTDAMMKKADIAMYHAKALGRNNFQFYNVQMDQNASRRFVISNSLRKGLEQNQFRLFYQPKVDMNSGRIMSMEALVRWDHPELGMLSPMEFIQLAEETGLIVNLGEWVLREACRQNMLWRNEGIKELRVAVNLSGYQLQHKNLLASIMAILKETGLPPECLEFEITESVIMQNPDFAVSVLTSITNMGIHISIDDFGTGYSSLAHLKRFSVNTIKIDKSFVRDVNMSSTDAAIATAIIAMGNSLNLNVIAEGVETQEQYEFFKENNCGQVQGFLISKPLPSEEFIAILKENIASLEKQ